ncbi:MAG: hypothetical protein LBH42_03275 [Treponema sp.]|jgi:hypothetical protein|nr:hypothetical protein [Treponema sp.]
MIKKLLMVLIFFVLATGIVFAQKIPMNTITVDTGPLIIGLAFKTVWDNVIDVFSGSDDEVEIGGSASGFGIGAQYERQLTKHVSAAFRFAYLGMGFNLAGSGYGASAKTSFDAKAYSFEGHGRFYPFSKTMFFLDALIGYEMILIGLSEESSGFGYTSDKMSYTGNHLKYGAKLGWRIDFGKPGGFIFEPAFGWNFQTKLGSNFNSSEIASRFNPDVADYVDLIAAWVFAGGPRVELGFGWRF